MKTLEWYFDFISPFAYLQFNQLEQLPKTVNLEYKPILFAGLLNHWGHTGPAEIESKRIFTYRHTLWLARRHNIPFRMPPAHPFNPLRALRLAIACDNQKTAIDEIFRWIWAEGHSLEDENAWNNLIAKLDIDNAEEQIGQPSVKAQLRDNTDRAISLGVFGVPTFVLDQELLWGFDTLTMLQDFLKNPDLFQDSEMQRLNTLPVSVHRKGQ